MTHKNLYSRTRGNNSHRGPNTNGIRLTAVCKPTSTTDRSKIVIPKITACSTLDFSLSPLEVALQHLSDYGYEYVEIAEMLTHSKHFPIETVDPIAVRTLLHKYSLKPVAANVTLTAYYAEHPGAVKTSLGKHSSAETEEIKKAKQNCSHYRLHVKSEADQYAVRVRTLIDKAKIAGIPILVFNAGRKEHVEDIDRDLKTAAEVLDKQAEYAKKSGIRVLLEMPHVWQVYDDVEKSKQMLAYLQSDNIGVLIDSTHWHVSRYDIDDYVSTLQDRLWHIHLRDAAGKDSPAEKYLLEITPGEGEVNFKLLGQTLDKYSYDGNVTLETEYKNYKDPAEVDHKNVTALAFLKSVGWEVADQGKIDKTTVENVTRRDRQG